MSTSIVLIIIVLAGTASAFFGFIVWRLRKKQVSTLKSVDALSIQLEDVRSELARTESALMNVRSELDGRETALISATSLERELRAELESQKEGRVVAGLAAEQREADLMVITHQIQGPLNSVAASISALMADSRLSGRGILKNTEALVEDALLLLNGIAMSLAIDGSKQVAFAGENIDAVLELRRLCERLRIAHARDDLDFQFSVDERFPDLRINRQVFLNVMYTLIHNVLKYADVGSVVEFKCGFESDLPTLKVKSVGELIHRSEQSSIFDKFNRGKEVRGGRHHVGQGLGLWIARELLQAVDGDLRLELSDRYPDLSIFVVYPPE